MKVAVIGLGVVSRPHVNALKTCGQEIVALCDVKAERCESTNKEFGLSAAVYTDYKKMLAEVKPDVVHICTPHYLHADMICDALGQDIHVLCEKPVAINEDQLAQIERAVEESKATLAVCQQNRFNPAMRVVKDFFKDKKVTAACASVFWCRDAEYYHSESWRGKWETEGGGVMINQALHTLDILQWICGMPHSVSAAVDNHSLQGVIEVEDTAFGRFSYDGGAFTISATNAEVADFPVSYQFRAGEDVVQMVGYQVIINGKAIVVEEDLPLVGKAVWGTSHLRLIARFYECLESGTPFEVDFAEAKKVIRMILAMYKSKGKKVPVS